MDRAQELVEQSDELFDADDFGGAQAAAEEAVVLARARAATDPGTHRLLGMALTKLAQCLAANGHEKEAVTAGRESVEIFRRLLAAEPAAHEFEAANACSTYSALLDQTGRPDEAFSVMQEALVLRRSVFTRDGSLDNAIALFNGLSEMDDRLEDVDRPDIEAAVAQERGLALRAMVGADPHTTDVRVATMLAALAVKLQGQGQDSATEVAQMAIDMVDDLQETAPATRAEAARLLLTAGGVRGKESPVAASPAVEQAVRLLRGLDREFPDTYRRELAAALTDQANWLGAAGHRMQAWKVGREAKKLVGG